MTIAGTEKGSFLFRAPKAGYTFYVSGIGGLDVYHTVAETDCVFGGFAHQFQGFQHLRRMGLDGLRIVIAYYPLAGDLEIGAKLLHVRAWAGTDYACLDSAFPDNGKNLLYTFV